MNQVNQQISAVKQLMLEHAIMGALISYHNLKTVEPQTPPPRRLRDLTLQEVVEIDRAYRIAYLESRNSSLRELNNSLRELINAQESMMKPTRGSSTAFITKGS